jgi:hypothetical protein
MKKIEDIHRAYHESGRGMTVKERINYCVMIIYNAHNYLSRHTGKLTGTSRTRTREILLSAESELSQLVTKWEC